LFATLVPSAPAFSQFVPSEIAGMKRDPGFDHGVALSESFDIPLCSRSHAFFSVRWCTGTSWHTETVHALAIASP
jgi:hypothetical protein